MANPFGLREVTMAQLIDSTHAINLVDATAANAASPRKSVYQPITVIVTNHVDTTSNLTTDWPDGTGAAATPEAEEHLNTKVAVFLSRRHGEPWEKDRGLNHIIAKGVVDLKATVVYPDFDYSTFE